MSIIVPFAGHHGMKLGKRPRRHDSRTLKLARYLSPALPPAPVSVDYTHGITDWGAMLNTDLSCCTISAVGHAVQAWSLNALGREFTVPDAVILQYYEKWDGYNPSDPSTDQGGIELDVLNDFRQQGFDGVTLDAYASVDITHPDKIKQAVWMFVGAYIGVELPLDAQDQDVWDVTTGPGGEPASWGGHAIYLVGYDALTLTCITWGAPKKMTWAWLAKYCSEAYALVSKACLNSSGVSPVGLNLSAMDEDVQLMAA